MIPIRASIGAGGAILAVLIIWAMFQAGDLHGSFFDQFSVVTALPWGVVSLVDLYLGFAILAVVIVLTERNWPLALFWAAPLFVLGNVWAALWLVIRLPRLAQALNSAAPPSAPPPT